MISKKSYYYVYVFVIVLITLFISWQLLQSRRTDLRNGIYLDERANIERLGEYLEGIMDVERVYKPRNSFGFPDEEWSKEKDNNTYRIMAIGDSMTEGPGIRNNETWPKHLENILNSEKVTDREYKVMNMGIGGRGTSSQFEDFEELSTIFDFDMVILQYYNNDPRYVSLHDMAKERTKKRIEQEDFTNIEEEIEMIIPEGKTKEDISDDLFKSVIYEIELDRKRDIVDLKEDWDEGIRESLKEFVRLTEKQDKEFLIVTWDSVEWQMEKMRDFVGEHDVPFYDFSDKAPLDLEKYRLPDNHLNSLGCEVVANNTYMKIKDIIEE